MLKPGRLPCINPACNRTGSAEKHVGCTEICCYKCWKKTPKELTSRYKSLWKTNGKLQKMVQKRLDKGEPQAKFAHSFDHVWREIDRNWGEIRRYWQVPTPEMPPEGLDTFLKEVGLS